MSWLLELEEAIERSYLAHYQRKAELEITHGRSSLNVALSSVPPRILPSDLDDSPSSISSSVTITRDCDWFDPIAGDPTDVLDVLWSELAGKISQQAHNTLENAIDIAFTELVLPDEFAWESSTVVVRSREPLVVFSGTAFRVEQHEDKSCALISDWDEQMPLGWIQVRTTDGHYRLFHFQVDGAEKVDGFYFSPDAYTHIPTLEVHP